MADRYQDALASVAKTGSGSTSRLQRELGIGYNEACRYMERMEAEGRVTRPDSRGKRELIPPHQVEGDGHG